MAKDRIGVVGGGLAGLSAARELKRLGYTVDLFERTRLLGGKATSFRVGGVEVDNGQHVFLACCSELIDFVASLPEVRAPDGPATWMQERFEAILLRKGSAPVRLRAAALPAPLHLVPALLTNRHLSLSDRLRAGWGVMAARLPVAPEETFARWLDRRHQSPASRSAFWHPFLVPALNAPPEEASAESAMFVIATAFLGDHDAARFGFARVPLARFAEAAAATLDSVRLRTPVVELDAGPGGANRRDPIAIVLGDGSRLEYEGVVLAVPPARLRRILRGYRQYRLPDLNRFRYSPIVDVHLWYDTGALGLGFAALIDSPVQWVFEKGPGYLCCSLSAANRHVGESSDALVVLCREELETVLPQLSSAQLLRGAATRDREATFIPLPGLERPGPETARSGVVIAGAWTDTGWPDTMESAVRSGRAAARALAAQLDRGRRKDDG
ncbi:MAG TPA: hydroxysqualene dehydroxylase HpnE [Chloroflexota bacterium]|nr:hydroxysqualene dehydroxylase HpnE [Chloroflexota bacterium]